LRSVFIYLIALVSAGSVVAAQAPTFVDQLFEQYSLMHKSLASDSTAGVAQAAAKFAQLSRRALEKESKAKPQLVALSDAASRLRTSDLKTTRQEFGELSKHLTAYLQAAGVEKRPYQFYCSMVNRGWLQPDKNIRNPYYGSSMLECGELIP
jgi:hypothetical protein